MSRPSFIAFAIFMSLVHLSNGQVKPIFSCGISVSDYMSSVVSTLGPRTAYSIHSQIFFPVARFIDINAGIGVISRGWAEREYMTVGLDEKRILIRSLKRTYHYLQFPVGVSIGNTRWGLYPYAAFEILIHDQFVEVENKSRTRLSFPEDLNVVQLSYGLEAGIKLPVGSHVISEFRICGNTQRGSRLGTLGLKSVWWL